MSRSIKFFIVLIVLTLLSPSTFADKIKPSFNCSKATTQEERLICSGNKDYRLDILDFLIADKYQYLMKNLPPADASKLEQEQKEWLKNRTLATIRELNKKSGAKIPFDDDEYILERYLDDRHTALTHKVLDLSKQDLSPGSHKTEIADHNMASKLLGKRNLTLQWLSWDQPGQVSIYNKDGVFLVHGEQANPSGYVKIYGWISKIESHTLTFIGSIETLSEDSPACKREGRFTFAITKNRPYWRLQEMKNPCSNFTDYVDIYFAGPKIPI